MAVLAAALLSWPALAACPGPTTVAFNVEVLARHPRAEIIADYRAEDHPASVQALLDRYNATPPVSNDSADRVIVWANPAARRLLVTLHWQGCLLGLWGAMPSTVLPLLPPGMVLPGQESREGARDGPAA